MSYPHRHRTTSQWTFPLQGAIRTYPVPLERRDRLGPSSQAPLLRPGPLRTGRETFASSGSSPSNASLGETRLRYVAFDMLPARYGLGVGERCGEWLASRWRTIAPLRLKPHQRLAPSSSALSQKPISPVLSREGPRGSLPAFASGDVADMSICLTQPVSPLLPRSLRFLPDVISAPPSVHLAVDFPFAGSDTDLSCSVGKTRWVRFALYVGSVVCP